jgi:hypothetical protein
MVKVAYNMIPRDLDIFQYQTSFCGLLLVMYCAVLSGGAMGAGLKRGEWNHLCCDREG